VPSFGFDIQRVDTGIMEVVTLEIDDDGCGRLQFELPADATAEEVAYIESLVPRIETGLLELWDPGTGEVVFSCRPSLTGESLLKTATRSAVKLRH
jgi:hypothetical protein